ncbi:IQ motif and SEC7 domain-containing protein 1 isoform X6 [Penaeus vannamei]|uniref:IQ motif and SEC7 domain-containing protein 1 isoform X6 n=1 Tax=Penaeus vannamei TaxID=6689 RepID=UPI00387F47B7
MPSTLIMWKRKLSFKRKGPRPTRRLSQPLVKSLSLPETYGVPRSCTPPLRHSRTDYCIHGEDEGRESSPGAITEGEAVDVVTGDDDVIQAILRRKDSDLESLETPDLDTSLKKNSIIRFKDEEGDEYWRRVGGCSVCERNEARRAAAAACPLCARDVRAAREEDAAEGAGENEAAPEGEAAGSLLQENGDDTPKDEENGDDTPKDEENGGESQDDREEVHENERETQSEEERPQVDEGRSRDSSPVKVDRPYCGKGPPPNRGVGPGITKSYSVEGAAPPVPPHHLHHGPPHHHHNGSLVRRPQMPQAVSQSSGVGMGGRRQAPRGAAADDSSNRGGRWRGSGAPGTGHGYELSQDLADMRLEMLERRYGGEVARRAAVTIQRAYRHYAMYKKFRSITATAKAQEKRLSRRFTVDVPEWNDTSNQHYHDAEHFIRSEFDQLQRNLSATVYGEGRRPARSLSLRDTPRTTTPATSTTSSRIQQDNHDLHDTLAAMNDSSLYCHVSAHSPLTPTSTPTPAPTHARNGSGDYQHQGDVASYASSRDIKYISSDEGGFGSQDSANMARLTVVNQRRGVGRGKKIPPEVPRRSSSIKSSESSGSVDSAAALSTANHRVQCHPPSLTPPSSTPSSLTSEGGHSDRGALRRSADNGSLSSVQSSGSDSSLSQSTSDRATPLSTHDQVDNSDYHPTSPIWKRKNQMSTSEVIYDDKRLSNISENSEDSLQSHSSEGMTYSQTIPSQIPHSARYAHAHYTHTPHMPKVPEVVRKRQYRVGLNLFNKKPERGVTYLIGRGFLENSPQAVAKFLLTRKGLSKQMIGEYLGNLQNSFNMAVLECFAQEIDLSGMQVDVALRKFQTHFRMPGEAQKIERLMQVFAQRYCQCNRDIVAKLRDPETIFVLAFAIIMLNTDLHTASMKQEKRMKIEDFIKNLRGIDDGYDIEREMLEGMYQRIKAQEFRPGHDHVTQVLKVQQTMVGKKPNLALPHRRLVCYCRLYEIPDITKKERVGVHQREVFLFNDLLVVTKIFSKKKNSVTYTFRQSYPLAGLVISTKEVPHYPYLMEVRQRVDNKVLIIFNARNEHDRTKFCEDLKESVCEMDEMESLRIEGELEKQKASLRASRPNSTTENRDSGVADMELLTTNEKNGTLKSDSTLKRSALSNSLLDIHEAVH